MILSLLGGPLVFLAGLIIMLLIVPWDKVKSLLWIGLLIGFGIALVLLLLMQNLFGFWVFYRVDLINIGGIPVFLSAAWIPLIILFSYLSSRSTNLITIGALIIAFPLSATIVHLLLILNGMLFYNEWNLVLTFLLSVGIHLGIAYYLYSTGIMRRIKIKV